MPITKALAYFEKQDPKHAAVAMAKRLGVTRAAVYKWIDAGELPVVRSYQMRDILEGRDK